MSCRSVERPATDRLVASGALIYAPFIPPRWNDSRDIYFTLSRFDLYNVWLWHTSLPDEHRGTGTERCINAG